MGNAESYSISAQTSAVFTLRRRNTVRIGMNPAASGNDSDNKRTQSSTEHRHQVLELVFRTREVLGSNLDQRNGYFAFSWQIPIASQIFPFVY